MAQLNLDSKEIKKGLVALQKGLVAAIGWVDRRPRRIKIAVPDDLFHRRDARGSPIKSLDDCGNVPIKVTGDCSSWVLPVDRARVEVLIVVLQKMARDRAASATRGPE